MSYAPGMSRMRLETTLSITSLVPPSMLLALVRSHSPLFYLTWTVLHPIDQTSPLYGLDVAQIAAAHTEVMVSLTGMDETFSQTINSRFSYTAAELMIGRRFADIVRRESDGSIRLELSKLHDLADQQHSDSV